MSTPTPLRAETFLRELQGAVSSRRLYASEHPRNVEIMDKLEVRDRVQAIIRAAQLGLVTLSLD